MAKAQGFEFAELEYAADFAIRPSRAWATTRSPCSRTSEAGRRTEIDTLNLAVVERGEEYGVDTPLNWMIGILILALEQRFKWEHEARRAAAEPSLGPDGLPVFDPAAAAVIEAALRNGSRLAGPPASREASR